MTLDIVVPHYKEPWETCHYIFDTLATQRGFDFNDLRVLVVNDGDCLLDEKHFEGYPFRIEYLVKEHGGISAARNYGLDHSDADYVMFCDADDGFLNNYGLHLVESAMKEEADYIVSNFVEETVDEKGNQVLVRHDVDLTFMHGKVYKRQFLVENDLRFDPAMTIHEDGYFNMVVFVVATRKGKQKNIETPFYLWRWNDNSTVRSDKEDFVLKTYESVIQTRIGVCEQLKARGYEDEFRTSVCMTVMNCYYDHQKTSYHVAKNAKYLRKAEKAVKKFFDMYGAVFNDLTFAEIAEVANNARANAYKNGLLIEQETLKEFIHRIETEVKA